MVIILIQVHRGYSFTTVSIFSDIPQTMTVIPDSQKRFFVVNNLLPNNGYTFRVAAKNDIGVGLTSKPKGI